MNFCGWMFVPFGRSILQAQYLHLNMRMSQFSDVIVYVRTVGPAQLSSKRGTSCPSMFAQQKGAHTHTQRRRIAESWPSRINALFVASFSVVNVQPNSTSDNPLTSKCARAVAVLLCLSLKFLVLSSVRTVLLSLPRCLSCGTMCRNMCQGPGPQKQDNSLSFSSMDAWELGPQPSEKQPQKRVAIGADKELAKAVHLIARLCLKNSLEVRELQAACCVTFIAPKASPYVQAMLGATKQYADKAKASQMGKCEHPPGEPHVHAWAALLRVALEDTALSAEDCAAVEQHRAMSTDPIIMSGVVYVAKLRKAFDKNTMKMFFSVHRDAEPALAALTKGVLHNGGKLKRGQAPRSGLEREVQEVVDHLSEILVDRK